MSSNLFLLKELSVKIGKDTSLIQSSGGNTSIKENGLIWIKASGKKLRNALDDNDINAIANRCITFLLFIVSIDIILSSSLSLLSFILLLEDSLVVVVAFGHCFLRKTLQPSTGKALPPLLWLCCSLLLPHCWSPMLCRFPRRFFNLV